jgi:hypothetical protein
LYENSQRQASAFHPSLEGLFIINRLPLRDPSLKGQVGKAIPYMDLEIALSISRPFLQCQVLTGTKACRKALNSQDEKQNQLRLPQVDISLDPIGQPPSPGRLHGFPFLGFAIH